MKNIILILSGLILYTSLFSSATAGTDTIEEEGANINNAMSAYFNAEGELLIKCESTKQCDFINTELAVKAVVPAGWSVSLPSVIEINHYYNEEELDYQGEIFDYDEDMSAGFDDDSDFDEKLMIEFYGPNGEHVGYNFSNMGKCRAEASKYGFCDDGTQATNPAILQKLSAGLGLEKELEIQKIKDLVENSSNFDGA